MNGLLNLFRVPEIRAKILTTIGLLMAYRVGFHIYLPGVNYDKLETYIQQDTGDSFWSRDVSLHELGEDATEGGTVVAGRYKTSDTVSYEDLLDFALDGVSERSA